MNSRIRAAAGFLLISLLHALAAQEREPASTYPDTDAGKHVGEDVTITGKVVVVSTSSKGAVYLNFGDRYPRHIFSAAVFAQDLEKVGDLKSYEGKSVAISGHVQQAPQDHKPQIVVKSADQIKLTEAGAVAPANSAPPPPPPPPAPASARPATQQPAPTPAAPSPSAVKKIVLGAKWNSPAQRGEMTRKDLAMLFGTIGSAGEEIEADPSIVLYPDIPLLAPLALAKKHLRLENVVPSVFKVTCPGLPLDSFTAHAFNGVFPGGYTQLCLITDNADQVVSLLLIDENSRQRTNELTDKLGYHTYNFISDRAKATNDLIVKHDIAGRVSGIVMVDSFLIDPNDFDGDPRYRTGTFNRPRTRKPTTGRILERSRWYVPQQLVNLILRCVGSR